jgi:hypothetical protein
MSIRVLLFCGLFLSMSLSLEAQIMQQGGGQPNQQGGQGGMRIQGGRNQPGMQGMQPGMQQGMMQGQQVDVTGTIEAIGQGRIQMADASGKKGIVAVAPQTTCQTTGEATAEFITAGLYLEFKAEADGKGGVTGKVDQLSVISLTKENPQGVFPEGGVDAGKATGAKKSTAPTGMCKFVGQLKNVRSGKYQLQAGRSTVLFELGENPKISIAMADAKFAAKGDKIEVSGMVNPNMPAVIQAKSVKITLSEPLGETKKKPEHPPKALKPKKDGKSEGLPAPAEDK